MKSMILLQGSCLRIAALVGSEIPVAARASDVKKNYEKSGGQKSLLQSPLPAEYIQIQGEHVVNSQKQI